MNTATSPAEKPPRLRWYQPTPARLLIVLLVIEGILLLSERWLPKGWAALIAVAVVGVAMMLMAFWFGVAYLFRRQVQSRIRSLLVLTVALLVALLVVEQVFLLSERWLPNGCSAWTTVASIASLMTLMFLWCAAALTFRWQFQFSLRSLLALTIVVAIPCSWMAVEMEQARGQRAAVQAIRELGGSVVYDYMWQRRLSPPGHALLRRVLGDDFFTEVTTANLHGPRLTESEVKHLKTLTKLQELCFVNMRVHDTLKYIKELRQALPNCEVSYSNSDAEPARE